ncbi:MAG: hypothetical protein WKF89_00095 [Chitinophagaceae bacterium]
MTPNQLTKKCPTMVGEEISHELGAKMVKDFQDANPQEITANDIGRNIIDSILAQPGCAGIRFYNAINEMGRKTLVYVGIDHHEQIITEYVTVNTSGQLTTQKGIVADRSVPPTKPPISKDMDTIWQWF